MATAIKKRKLSIDVAKGLGILLVILGHMNRFFEYNSRLNQLIYSVQLPVFLLIGGYWCRVKEGERFLDFVSGKFDRLIRPYFFFAFLSILYAWPVNAGQFGGYFAGMLWGIGINDYLPNLPIWFLPMFFWANILFYLILKIGTLGRKPWEAIALKCAATLAVMGIGWAIHDPLKRLPWGFEIAMLMQGFFLAGHLWRLGADAWDQALARSQSSEPLQREGRTPEGAMKKKLACGLLLAAVPAAVLWFVCVRLNGRVDINACWWGYNGFLSFYAASLAGSYLLLLASWLIARVKLFAWPLTWAGTHSMTLMAVHVPMLIWLDGVVTPLMPPLIQVNAMVKNWIGVGYSYVAIVLLSCLAARILDGRK